MKNLGTLILGLILGALAMYFYCCNSDSYDMVEAPIKPSGVITEAQAKVLSDAYTPRYNLVSDSIVKRKGGDNRSSWWSLEDMNNYLAYAQSQTDSLKYTMTGVRMYLGAHPTTPKGEPGYTTIFMVPTGYPTPPAGTTNLVAAAGDGDIPGGNGMNGGDGGNPPGANYPQ